MRAALRSARAQTAQCRSPLRRSCVALILVDPSAWLVLGGRQAVDAVERPLKRVGGIASVVVGIRVECSSVKLN